MTRDEALLRAIESDLHQFHRRRMARRQGEHMAALFYERSKPQPDAAVIDMHRAAMIQIQKDMMDITITDREVLEVLRNRIRESKEKVEPQAHGE